MQTDGTQRIRVTENGPLQVEGNVPIVRKKIVRDSVGNSVGWEVTAELGASEQQWLCRCGQSANKPFCDGSHRAGFFADDSVPAGYDEQATTIHDDPTVKDDRQLCMHARFCVHRGEERYSVWKPSAQLDNDEAFAQLAHMVSNCPSGALTMHGAEEPTATCIGVVDDGPYAVEGNIQIELADGSLLEPRARVTLCRCGHSQRKPLCDGSHAKAEFRDS